MSVFRCFYFFYVSTMQGNCGRSPKRKRCLDALDTRGQDYYYYYQMTNEKNTPTHYEIMHLIGIGGRMNGRGSQ